VDAVGTSGWTTTVAERPALTMSLGPGIAGSRADLMLNIVVPSAPFNAPGVTPICGVIAAR